MKRRSFKSAQAGLTLVEIIVVLVILSLLMGFLANNLFSAGDKAKAGINELQMKRLQQHINQYQLRYNSLPGSIRDLISCNDQTGPNCLPVADSEADLRDPWGTEYQYTLENGGRSYSITSLGANRIQGGSGADSDFSVKGP